MAGNYTDIVTASGCPSSPSPATTVTVNPTPATPTITPGGPTTFCEGGSVTLTSSSVRQRQSVVSEWQSDRRRDESGVHRHGSRRLHHYCHSQWLQQRTFNRYDGDCKSDSRHADHHTGGATTFCYGVQCTLTSSSATGNQWYLNGNPIGGATAQLYNAATAGDYTVTVTTNGCSSAPSVATAVTANTCAHADLCNARCL